MHLILCLDLHNGRLFNNRRQSSDRYMHDDIMTQVGAHRLFADQYTADQFDHMYRLAIFTDMSDGAPGVQDYFFLERGEVLSFLDKVRSIIIYRWDKVYPADVFLDTDALKNFSLQDKTEFEGYSHKTITKEVYRREAYVE